MLYSPTKIAIWCCDFDDCQKPAVRMHGECSLCNRHLCSTHLKHESHSCPTPEDRRAYFPLAQKADRREMKRLFRKIKAPALISRASFLRHGMPCELASPLSHDAVPASVMGGMNYHIELVFNDGVKWIARIRRSNAGSPPPLLRDSIIESEVSTLQFLETVDMPTPRVFDFSLEDNPDNQVGVGYILMEKLPGTQLSWPMASEGQKMKVMDQIADSFTELQKHPFNLMGSLRGVRPGPEDVDESLRYIGPFARTSLTAFVEDDEIRAIGPCTSRKEYLNATIQFIIDLIMREESYTERPVDAYIIHRYLLDSVHNLCLRQSTLDDTRFYLKHQDDKGDHILVDDDYNVTGIIDWEWAYTTSKSVAFNSPIGFLPVGDFYDGVAEIGEHEVIFAQFLENKGSPDMADIVRNGRIQHFFDFCCGNPILSDWEEFLGLFKGFRTALGGDDATLDWLGWKELAMRWYGEDECLKKLVLREQERST